MAIEYKLREFTVEEYHRLADVGVLRPEERVELLDGAIVEMSPLGLRHWRRHAAITAYFYEMLAKHVLIVPQGSFPLGRTNEPQPDIAILARECADPTAGYPAPEQIYAVIEIADSSLGKELGPKLRLYARHRIADYLVVDLNANVLLHHHLPNDVGYAACDELRGDDTFTLAACADIRLSAAAFLEPSRPPSL